MDARSGEVSEEYVGKGSTESARLRSLQEWGGQGMKWTGEVAAIEEIGPWIRVMLYSLVSICGEAIHQFAPGAEGKNI